MDWIKEYLISKRFSILSYVCVIIHFHCGVIFTAITTALRLSEMEKFSCAVDTKYATHKSYAEKTCFLRYDDKYNKFKFSAFVLFNFGSVVVVSVVYSLVVGNRIEEVERLSSGSDKLQTVAKKENNEQGRKSFYVFNCYFLHLYARFVICVLLITLQHSVWYKKGFETQYSCDYPELRSADHNMTPAKNANASCTNSTAKDKQFYSKAVTVCNGILALFALAEIIYLVLRRSLNFPWLSPVAWSCDVQFINAHFLRKRYVPNSCDIYKRKVLKLSLTPDVNYSPNSTCLEKMFVGVVIRTKPASHKFLKGIDRDEIYKVYWEVPPGSEPIEEIKGLFPENEKNSSNIPRTTLVIGRPGIGKTILSRKIMWDWAKGEEKTYQNKIAFFFKFQWFNVDQLQGITLKKFLQFGTELDEDEFESIFEEIWSNPQKAIFVFDGLDEFGTKNVEKIQCLLDQSRRFSNKDISCQMSAISIFVKILSGDMLQGATVLVTSRPTVNDVLCKLHFDRAVEIIGFRSDKIEQYVKQFCANHNRCDLEEKLLSHIKSSSELMDLCRIPVNCFILCVSLFECLIDSTGDSSALPTTLTTVYELVLVYLNKHHNRSNESKGEVLKKLQELAFNGMQYDQLIFNDQLVDQRMKESGILNCLPNPVFQIQTQVCFIHLTMQEYLAAKHILETKKCQQVKEFISSNIKCEKWHLVLQFLAGLLGMKIKMSNQYRSCMLMFKKYLSCDIEDKQTVCNLNHDQILAMKCIREMQDEDIAKEIVSMSALKNVTKISCDPAYGSVLYPSDVAAVVFLCKHLKFLDDICIVRLSSLDCSLQAMKLLHKRCIKSLTMENCHLDDKALEHCGLFLKSECQVKHTHSKLISLKLSSNGITGVGMDYLLGSQVYDQLKILDVSSNMIHDKGAQSLCNAMEIRQLKLVELNLGKCSLSSLCIRWLVKFLSNEHCGLTYLNLAENYIANDGVSKLCGVFEKETNCKLERLTISKCYLQEKCYALCKAFKKKSCGLTYLDLSNNDIGDDVMLRLFRVLYEETCQLTRLNVRKCLLTDKCVPTLCDALKNKRCKLTELNVSHNGITDECLSLLTDSLKCQSCSIKYMDIHENEITEKGANILNEVKESEVCKTRGLVIVISYGTPFIPQNRSVLLVSDKQLVYCEECDNQ